MDTFVGVGLSGVWWVVVCIYGEIVLLSLFSIFSAVLVSFVRLKRYTTIFFVRILKVSLSYRTLRVDQLV